MPDSLGQALREARRNSGHSFSWFARQAGYSESHLRSVENGHRAVTDDVAAAYDRVLETGGELASALALAGGAGAPVPWDLSGTLAVLAGLTSGGGVERRTFIAASGAAMAVLAARWRSALASSGHLLPGTGSRQVGQELVGHIGDRLDYLRHLDDELGSGDLAALAGSELAFIVRLLRGGSYTDAVGRRLYALAAEASRPKVCSDSVKPKNSRAISGASCTSSSTSRSNAGSTRSCPVAWRTARCAKSMW